MTYQQQEMRDLGFGPRRKNKKIEKTEFEAGMANIKALAETWTEAVYDGKTYLVNGLTGVMKLKES